MKRSYSTFLLPIVVGGAGCLTTDNNVGSLGNDSGVADGAGQVARDVQAQPADASPVYSPPADAAAPDAIGATKDAQDSPLAEAAVPDAASVGKDAAAPDAIGATKDVQDSPLLDGAAPDAVSVGKDAAPDSPEAGAAHQCQLNADGTCRAVTSNTTCTRFVGHRYDESADCYSTLDTTLGCCAAASGEVCALPTASGCYQVAVDGGIVAYWTPNLTTAAVTIPGGQTCDQSQYLGVPGAHSCGAVPLDAAVLPDAHVPVSLPLCATDDDCCVSVDTCYGTVTLGGKAGWGPVPGTHAVGDICPPCAAPAVQVQCKGGFCVGTRVASFAPAGMEQLTVSHCGYIAPPDAGAAPAISPHAVVDGGISYQTSWSCGGY